MNIFNSKIQEEKFEVYIKSIEDIISNIEVFEEKEDVRKLEKFKKNFILKIEDFFRDDRKLNIGVIGQVKSGKSSLLNSMLFSGNEILPKASTPKTATLTKIEYSTTNKMKVEYYSKEEWDVIKGNSEVETNDEIYESAREILKIATLSNVKIEDVFSKKEEVIEFDSYESLIGRLNDYVGENGKYTAFVKAVTLYIDKDELKEISIVDTPGLNDPIVSRTIRTKEFIEICDVVFFLSQSVSFLDKSDWELLSSQLPQKGVRKLVLVVSKYDSSLRDVLRHKTCGDDIFDTPVENANETDNILEAKSMVENKLRKRATEQINKYVEDLKKREASSEIIQVISECKEPVFISSMVYNMTNKKLMDYDKEELNVYNSLKMFSKNIDEDIKSIGDFSEIKAIFKKSIEDKEKLLEEKSISFIPNSKEEILNYLSDALERERKRLSILENSDLKQILSLKKDSEQTINSIKSDIVNILGEVGVKIETKKIEAIQELRKSSSEYSKISERIGTRTKTGSYSVSTSKWYNPFSWGTSRTEYYTYQESYSYLDVSDAVSNIHSYSNQIINKFEAIFIETASIASLKRHLLGMIVNNFDTAKENYDSAFFKLITEKTLNEIEFPIIKLDFTDKQNEITSKFTGEITSGSQKTILQQVLSQTISKIFDEVIILVEKEVKSFKINLDKITEKLMFELLKNIQSEFDEICCKFEDKEKQIDKTQKYILILEKELKK